MLARWFDAFTLLLILFVCTLELAVGELLLRQFILDWSKFEQDVGHLWMLLLLLLLLLAGLRISDSMDNLPEKRKYLFYFYFIFFFWWKFRLTHLGKFQFCSSPLIGLISLFDWCDDDALELGVVETFDSGEPGLISFGVPFNELDLLLSLLTCVVTFSFDVLFDPCVTFCCANRSCLRNFAWKMYRY